MQRIKLHKSESLYEISTDKIIVADEIQLDRENGVVRLVTVSRRTGLPLFIKTRNANEIGAMRRGVFGDITEAPVLAFDFVNEF